jgi:chaperonin GroES
MSKNAIYYAMNLQPLANRVILEPVEEEKVTKSGIVLPETSGKERPVRGTVIAVGPGKLNDKGERVPVSVSVGDQVLFKKYGPDEVELEGKKYLVADETDIVAVIK